MAGSEVVAATKIVGLGLYEDVAKKNYGSSGKSRVFYEVSEKDHQAPPISCSFLFRSNIYISSPILTFYFHLDLKAT